MMRLDAQDIEQMMAEVRQSHADIAERMVEVEAVSATATSKDRVLSATVDARGVLTDLRITGQSWRELAPKELCARIVDVVAKAQQDAQARGQALLEGLGPDAGDPMAGLPSADEMTSMLQGLVARLGEAPRER